MKDEHDSDSDTSSVSTDGNDASVTAASPASRNAAPAAAGAAATAPAPHFGSGSVPHAYSNRAAASANAAPPQPQPATDAAASPAPPSRIRSKLPPDIQKADLSAVKEAQGGGRVRFPWKLHHLLLECEANGDSDIISWLPCGTAFRVHDKEVFTNRVMPRFFHSTKYKTFQRSLNVWGFESVVQGADKGAVYHRFFRRGRLDLCRRMIRQGIKDPTCPTAVAAAAAAANKQKQGGSHGASEKKQGGAVAAAAAAPAKRVGGNGGGVGVVGVQNGGTLPPSRSVSAGFGPTTMSVSSSYGSGSQPPSMPMQIQPRPPQKMIPMQPSGHPSNAPVGAISMQQQDCTYPFRWQPPVHRNNNGNSNGNIHHQSSPHSLELIVQAAEEKAQSSASSPSFADRLHAVLEDPEVDSFGWRPHGRCFEIVDPVDFEQQVLRQLLQMGSMDAFKAELDSHGIYQIQNGRDAGCFYHDLLIRGLPHLCRRMKTPQEARQFLPDQP